MRNLDKGNAAAAGMPGDVEVRKLDLQDLSSVRAFADGVDAVDVLVNNAGIMAVPYAQTVDGFESQIGTNHLGHFALTNLLLPKVSDRVVTVSSMMHLIGKISLKDLNWKARPYSAWLAYGQSKLANLLFTSELQRRLDAAGSAVTARRGPPRLLGHQPAGPHRQGKISNALMSLGNKLATDADFGARQTLFAASQDAAGRQLHRAQVRDARADRAVRAQPAGAQREDRGAPCGTCPSSSPAPNFRSDFVRRLR